MDRRGRGASGDAAEYALEREAEDVVAVVGSIDEPAVLFGHSYGALVALEAALQADDLRGLVLYEPWFPVGGRELHAEDVLDELEALLDDGENERTLVLFLEDVVGLTPAEVDALRSSPNWTDRVEAAHTVLRESRAEVEYGFDPARFAGMTTPTLLLSGSESPRSVREMTDALEEALPNGRITVLEGQEHLEYYTAPELFVEEILAFVREG